MSAPLAWRRREPPLRVAAGAGRGAVAEHLAREAVTRLAGGAPLRASVGDGWLVLLGEPDDLPWVFDVTYLGWERGVLLPTTATITPGPEVVRSAVGAVAEELVVVLPDSILVSAMPTRVADPRRLVR